jgi:hypothetical protein
MKTSILSFMTAFLLILAVPAFVSADEKANEAESTETLAEIAAEAKAHINRLSEIKAMDFSELSSMEKKELRNEVRSISKEMKALGKADSEARANAEAESEASQAGLYISGSAIIVILLLLLLLR